MDTQSADFAEFYAAARDNCLRAVFASTGDLPAAEDLVAEAFARAWTRWRTVRAHPAPAAWVALTVVAANPSANGGKAVLDAWTVTRGPGDAVTVTIRQLYDPDGLQRALRADGGPARVEFQPGIASDSPPLPRGCTAPAMSDEKNTDLQEKILGIPTMNPQAGIALTINPRAIPTGIGIFLAANTAPGGGGFGWGLDLVVTAPSCTG